MVIIFIVGHVQSKDIENEEITTNYVEEKCIINESQRSLTPSLLNKERFLGLSKITKE